MDAKVHAAPSPTPTLTAGMINARLDRLPGTRRIWTLVLLLSLGGWFEFYDLFFTAYVGPGLVKSGILAETTEAFFGFSGLAAFIAATFAGLFIGTCVFGFAADRFGRRTVFTVSLLCYTACTVVMAFQTSAAGLNLWRLLAGVGIGVEFVTIDSYVAELVPGHMRGRAFAFNQMVMYSVVPFVALLAYLLVPEAPLGLDGWRWVVLIGAVGAVFVWFIRLGVPESPRWLAQHGRLAEADRIVSKIEARVAAEFGAPLPEPGPAIEPATVERGRFAEIFSPEYRGRTIMLMVFNFFQTIGYYGFASWVPTLLVARGITVTHSLLYSFVIAIANPIGPLLALPFADRVERKWAIVFGAGGIAVFGVAFSQVDDARALIALGACITLCLCIMSFGFHAYQPELFPTRVRARAIGFVYSMSRLSAMLSGFTIAFALRNFGASGAFTLIVGSMVVVVTAIGVFGPRTRGFQLEAITH
ncbi:MFS transporter [Aliidongia dinghuensis]|uniref:MFS transporter n=1 Tax=Aliidongia dinghuensis TaxID=1867774 RepID=A0A8J3E2M4_9PROT|nr:MFS transporter [Aliidongia dinghuensis]GGF11500.1 MFS transporter [Aliidongia dinghuensis]